MNLMGFGKTTFSSNSNEWDTPQWLFDQLNDEFCFTLGPCSSDENAKCKKHYTIADDGLSKSWAGERVFCNPPYGRNIKRWVKKCSQEEAELVVLLVFSRTDTAWFHDYVYGKAELRFLRGRLKFGEAKHNAPAPSMIAIFRKEDTDDH